MHRTVQRAPPMPARLCRRAGQRQGHAVREDQGALRGRGAPVSGRPAARRGGHRQQNGGGGVGHHQGARGCEVCVYACARVCVCVCTCVHACVCVCGGWGRSAKQRSIESCAQPACTGHLWCPQVSQPLPLLRLLAREQTSISCFLPCKLGTRRPLPLSPLPPPPTLAGGQAGAGVRDHPAAEERDGQERGRHEGGAHRWLPKVWRCVGAWHSGWVNRIHVITLKKHCGGLRNSRCTGPLCRHCVGHAAQLSKGMLDGEAKGPASFAPRAALWLHELSSGPALSFAPALPDLLPACSQPHCAGRGKSGWCSTHAPTPIRHPTYKHVHTHCLTLRRAQDQADRFEKDVGLPNAVLFFDCPEEEMEKRLLKRGETSGRSDDNAGVCAYVRACHVWRHM